MSEPKKWTRPLDSEKSGYGLNDIQIRTERLSVSLLYLKEEAAVPEDHRQLRGVWRRQPRQRYLQLECDQQTHTGASQRALTTKTVHVSRRTTPQRRLSIRLAGVSH